MNELTIERIQSLFDENEIAEIIKNGEALLQFAYENIEIGSYSDAAMLFHIYLTEFSHSAEALNGLAVCMYETEEYNKASHIIDYTMQRYPEDPITLSNKASLCWQFDNYEQAVYYYTMALALDPQLIESQLNIVNLYRENGDILLAYIYCLKFYNNDPENRDIKELLDSLMIDIAIMFY